MVDDGNDRAHGDGNGTDGYTTGTEPVIAPGSDTAASERPGSVEGGGAVSASGNADTTSERSTEPSGSGGSDSGEREPGVEYVPYTTRSGQPAWRRKRRDSRDYSDGGNRGSTAASGGTTGTSEETGSVGQDTARVNPPRRTRGPAAQAAMPGNVKEMLADGMDLLYWSIATASAIPEWELDKVESKELAEKTQNFVNSLDPVSARKFEKFANKFFPGLVLLGTAAVITYPRVKITQQVMRQRRESARSNSPEGSTRARAPERPAAQPVSRHAPTSSDTGNVAANNNGNGAGVREYVAVPLTTADLAEIRIRDDEPAI